MKKFIDTITVDSLALGKFPVKETIVLGNVIHVSAVLNSEMDANNNGETYFFFNVILSGNNGISIFGKDVKLLAETRQLIIELKTQNDNVWRKKYFKALREGRQL